MEKLVCKTRTEYEFFDNEIARDTFDKLKKIVRGQPKTATSLYVTEETNDFIEIGTDLYGGIVTITIYDFTIAVRIGTYYLSDPNQLQFIHKWLMELEGK